MEYGLLIYDVPSSEGKLYYRLRNAIGEGSIRINLSVWLIPWAQKEGMERVISEAGCQGYAQLIKFDGSASAELEVTARKCLQEQAGRILTDLQKEIDAEERKSSRVSRAKRRLAEAQSAALVFGFTQDVASVFEACKKLLCALVSSRYVDTNQQSLPFPTAQVIDNTSVELEVEEDRLAA